MLQSLDNALSMDNIMNYSNECTNEPTKEWSYVRMNEWKLIDWLIKLLKKGINGKLNECMHEEPKVLQKSFRWDYKPKSPRVYTLTERKNISSNVPSNLIKFKSAQLREKSEWDNTVVKKKKDIMVEHSSPYHKEKSGLLFNAQYGPIANTTKSE